MTAPLDPAQNPVGAYLGPARIIYVGDFQRCSALLREGRVLLGNLRHALAQGGITEGQRAYTTAFGARVEAFHKGGINTIRITAPDARKVLEQGFAMYQFLGTAGFMDETYIDPNMAGRHCPRYFATHVAVYQGKPRAIPLYSNYEYSTDDPPRWFFEDDPKITYPQPHLIITPGHQPDGRGIHPWYGIDETSAGVVRPNRVADAWLGTTWAQCRPVNGLTSNVPGDMQESADRGWDYPPMLYDYARASILLDEDDQALTDWWRRAARRTVRYINAQGQPRSRTFIVMVDVSNTFHAFVPGAPMADTVQSIACPWPDWANIETVGKTVSPLVVTDYLKSLMPLWEFNHAGTRAACVVAHRADPWTQSGVTSSHYSAAGALLQTVRDDSPGLVEVEFVITITGDEPAQFTFAVQRTQSIYSLTDDTIPVAVGYAAVTMGDVAQDALLRVEYEHYLNPITLTQSYPDHNPVARHPDKVSYCVVKQYANGEWVEVRRWLAFGLFWQGPTPFTANFDFPIESFPGIAVVPTDVYAGSVPNTDMVWITQINTLDLTTLSFSVCATAYINGRYMVEEDSTYRNYVAYAEAAGVGIVVKNRETRFQTVGNAHIAAFLQKMLWVQDGAKPHLTGYTRFYVDATVDYTRTVDEFSVPHVTIAVHNHGATATTAEVVDPYNIIKDYATGYPPIIHCPLYSAYERVEQPEVFAMFDHTFRFVRPGHLLYDLDTSDDPVAGGLTGFTGYPAGAVHNSLVTRLTQMNMMDTNGRLRVHPNGSWSVCYGPVAAQTALMTHRVSDPESPTILNTYAQIVVDHLHLVTPGVKETTVDTTHLAMFNAAFRSEVTAFNPLVEPTQFYFTLRDAVGRLPQIQYDRTTLIEENEWFDVHKGEATWIFPPGVLGLYFATLTLTDASHGEYAMITPIVEPSGLSTVTGQPAYTRLYFRLPHLRMESLYHFGKTA